MLSDAVMARCAVIVVGMVGTDIRIGITSYTKSRPIMDIDGYFKSYQVLKSIRIVIHSEMIFLNIYIYWGDLKIMDEFLNGGGLGILIFLIKKGIPVSTKIQVSSLILVQVEFQFKPNSYF